MSQITQQILLGGIMGALNGRWLQSRGVTHVVNASAELSNYFPRNFKYLRLDLDDTPEQDLSRAFNKSYYFIKNAIDNGGIVFVHCFGGISRSTSQVIYYLMIDNGISFERSLNYVRRKHRRTNPNRGFQYQLMMRDPTKKFARRK